MIERADQNLFYDDNDKFSKTYAAELSIGTGEIHFNKLKVLTNQKNY